MQMVLVQNPIKSQFLYCPVLFCVEPNETANQNLKVSTLSNVFFFFFYSGQNIRI